MSASTQDMNNGAEIGCIDLQTDNFTVEWVIKNATRLPRKIGERIFSLDFYTDNNKGNKVKWYLRLEPQGETGSSEGLLSIHLHRELEGESTSMKLHVELCTPQRGTTQTLICTYKGTSEDEHEEKLRRSELLKSCDTLRIICKIDIPGETLDTTEYMMPAFDSKGGQLHQDFRLLFNKPKLSDVSILVGTQKFPAHKVVLTARSSVFSAMFDHEETQENIKKEVKIEEMEPAVVEAMLEFFYTDEVTNLKELASGLLAAAEKYDVQRLKNMCEKVLYKTINKDNAAEIFVHADLYRSYQLKEYVMNFMDDNLVDVIESDSYKEIQLKYPALLGDIINTIARRRKTNK